MRLNAAGQACHGLLTLSIDGQTVLPAVRSTAPDWLLDTSVICQVEEPPGSDHWHLKAYNLTRKSWRLVDPNPATFVFASQTGVWAAWRSSGVRSNLHPSLPGAGLWGVGHDGTLGYCRSQKTGTGIVFRSTTGLESEVLARTELHDVQIVGYGIAAAVSRGQLVVVGAPSAVTVDEEIFGPRLVQLRTGIWWVLYHTQNRLLLQPVADPVGYVIHPAPGTYGSDVVELPSGLLRVVWSKTAGEGFGQFMRRDVDIVTEERVELGPMTPPPPERPRVTILSYEPQAGVAPVTVTAVRGLSGGPATRLVWRQRLLGTPAWTTVADNPARDPDHHFYFTSAGVYKSASM